MSLLTDYGALFGKPIYFAAESISKSVTQPKGLADSSRGLSAQQRAIPPDQMGIVFVTLKVSQPGTPSGCKSLTTRSGGLRFASTPGYFLTTLRVASEVVPVH